MVEAPKSVRAVLFSRTSQNALNIRIRRHGDVSRLVNEALGAVDLEKLKVVERKNVRGTTKADLVSRTIVFDPSLLELAKEVAEKRSVSLNVLVDSAVATHFGRRK